MLRFLLWNLRFNFYSSFVIVKNSLGSQTLLTLSAPNPQNGQTVANELFECAWTFCVVGA